MGCYVQTGKDTIEKDGSVDLAIGNNRKKDLVSILEDYLARQKKMGRTVCDVIDVNQPCEYEEMKLEKPRNIPGLILRFRMAVISFAPTVLFPTPEDGSGAAGRRIS